MKNKKSKVLKLYTKGLKQGMDESLIQALQDRIKELEQINEEHIKINGELREENNSFKEVGIKLGEELEKYNYAVVHYREEARDYKARIDKAIDMLNLIIPELWNINNHVTYKIQDVRRILQGKSDE